MIWAMPVFLRWTESRESIAQTCRQRMVRHPATLFSGREVISRSRALPKPKGGCLVLCVALLLLLVLVVGPLAAQLVSI